MKYPDEIEARFGPGEHYNECITGWNDMIIELDRQLALVCPDYTIAQIKEKLGSLRFYTDGVPNEHHHFIDEAELQSQAMCMKCGAASEIFQTDRGWLTNLCPKHREEIYGN